MEMKPTKRVRVRHIRVGIVIGSNPINPFKWRIGSWSTHETREILRNLFNINGSNRFGLTRNRHDTRDMGTKGETQMGYTGYGSTDNKDDPYNTRNGEMKCKSIVSGEPAIQHDPFNTEDNEMTIKPSLWEANNNGLGGIWVISRAPLR